MTTTVFVHSLNVGRGKWSKYILPYSVEAFAQLGDALYIRTGDRIVRVVQGLLTDHLNGAEVAFSGLVQWPWMDAGTPGATKKMKGFDLVASGDPRVSFGWDQTNLAKFTTPYAVNPDTMTGGIIALPLMAPSFSLKITFQPNVAWSLRSATIYLSENRGQP